MMNWSEHEKEEVPPPVIHDPWWLSVLIGIGCAFAFAIIVGGLIGCAATRDAEVCYMKPIGMTEEGFTVALQQCMSPEAFQKATE